MSARRNSSSFSTRSTPCAAAFSAGQVLAPGDRLHAKGEADAGDGTAEPPEAQQAERLAGDAVADAGLPSALTHELMVLGDAPGGAEDQPPGELGGILVAAAGAAGAAHRDAAILKRRHVERGVAHAGRDQQLQLRQALDDGFRKRRTLAHCRDKLGIGERAHHRVLIGESMPLDGDFDAAAPDRRPVRHIERDTLVVIENAEPHRCVPPLFRTGCQPAPSPSKILVGPT